jgi:hypothetical protein
MLNFVNISKYSFFPVLNFYFYFLKFSKILVCIFRMIFGQSCLSSTIYIPRAWRWWSVKYSFMSQITWVLQQKSSFQVTWPIFQLTKLRVVYENLTTWMERNNYPKFQIPANSNIPWQQSWYKNLKIRMKTGR